MLSGDCSSPSSPRAADSVLPYSPACFAADSSFAMASSSEMVTVSPIASTARSARSREKQRSRNSLSSDGVKLRRAAIMSPMMRPTDGFSPAA